MSEVIKRLRDRRQNVWEQAKKLADSASDENRAFNAEEQKSWDEMNAELDALDRRVKAVIDGEQRAKETEEAFSKLEGKPAERQDGTQADDDELRAFLRGDPGAPRHYDVRPDGPVNFRDLLKSEATKGEKIVPISFYDRLIAHLIETSAILQAGATVLNTGSGETIQVPKTLTHSSAAIVTEGSAIGESDPTFGQISLGAFKYGTLIQVSRELLNDNGVDLEGYLAMQAGRALGNAFGAHAVTGDGSAKPRGIVTDATVGVTGPTGTTTTFGDQSKVGEGADLLISLLHSVIAPYRASKSCGWLMNDTTASKVRRIKSTEGVYAWQPSLVAGQPDTLLAKPVLIDPNVASPAANALSIVFGDFAQYFVRLAGGVRFERSDDFAFNTDLVTYRALLRADGALVDLTGAVKTFKHSAT
jgi:HK97 family phage major capsid protein